MSMYQALETLHKEANMDRMDYMKWLGDKAREKEAFNFFGNMVTITRWEISHDHFKGDTFCMWLSDGSKFEIQA